MCSDHYLLTYTYNFYKANFESYHVELCKIKWPALFKSLTLEECVSEFYFILRNLVEGLVIRKLIINLNFISLEIII